MDDTTRMTDPDDTTRMTDPDDTQGMPAGAAPEVDDSGNPTQASPEALHAEDLVGTGDPEPASVDSDTWSSGSGASEGEGWSGSTAGADTPSSAADSQEVGDRGSSMVGQLQAMIDNLTTQAAPVLRDVAAKAAELAAVAAEKAGPLAQRAAERTQVVGERVAARSKEMAADLRRSDSSMGEAADVPADEGSPDDHSSGSRGAGEGDPPAGAASGSMA